MSFCFLLLLEQTHKLAVVTPRKYDVSLGEVAFFSATAFTSGKFMFAAAQFTQPENLATPPPLNSLGTCNFSYPGKLTPQLFYRGEIILGKSCLPTATAFHKSVVVKKKICLLRYDKLNQKLISIASDS